jgi:hypothetical protein
MNIKQLAQRIPWIVALPVFAVAITGILLFLAAVQEEQFWTEHPGFTDTPMELQMPAELFAELLNGPSFLFNLPVHGIDILGISVYTGRLPAVAIFWTWIGWAVDRRLRDAHWLLVKPLWLRRVSYVALLAFAVFFHLGNVRGHRFTAVAPFEISMGLFGGIEASCISAKSLRNAGLGSSVCFVSRKKNSDNIQTATFSRKVTGSPLLRSRTARSS